MTSAPMSARMRDPYGPMMTVVMSRIRILASGPLVFAVTVNLGYRQSFGRLSRHGRAPVPRTIYALGFDSLVCGTGSFRQLRESGVQVLNSIWIQSGSMK